MINQAIDINHIIASNSRILMETKLVKELETAIEKLGFFSEVDKKQTVYWVLRFLKFHNHQHPTDLAQTDIESFLSSLATENHYNQKLQQSVEKSLRFLYKVFLKQSISQLNYISVQQRKGYLSYFGENKCKQVVSRLSGKSLLILELMLLGKLRLSEVAKLRESDVDIKKNRINIFDDNIDHTDRKLLFTISIPLKLILDLRIQKMRIKQRFGYSYAGSSDGCFNRSKSTKKHDQKNNLLFHSGYSSFSSTEKVINIKQEFKYDLKQALATLISKPINYVDSKNKIHFQQLRMALEDVGMKKLARNQSGIIVAKLNRNQVINKNIQFELEVA